MVKNYLTIAWRNLIRSKTFSFINILGLAIGMAAALLVIVFVSDELSYDKFHSKKDNIYRLSFTEERQDNTMKFARVPFPVREVMMGTFPEIIEITRLYNNTKVSGAAMIHVGEEIYAEPDQWFAEPSFFEVFDFEFVQGSKLQALKDDHTAIITESTAKKYFGDADPIGRKIKYYKNTTVEVTGVVKDPPFNSHIQFSILLPVELIRNIWRRDFDYDFEKDWKWAGSHSYMLLGEGSSIKSINEKLPQLVTDHFQEVNESFQLIPFPLLDIYLRSPFDGEMNPSENQRITQLYIFSFIALIILLVACINFMNLSTARSLKRAREVGIRKVMGAQRRSLIFQFMGEAMLISFLALVHALVIVNLLLPFFNYFTGKEFIFSSSIFNIELMLLSIGLTILIGLFSGTYPALFLSSFKPAKTLKNDFKVRGGFPLRKALVIMQFIITFIFITAVIVIYEQLDYIRNKDLGFSKEQTLIINNRNVDSKEYRILEEELMKNPDVSDVYLGHIPGRTAWGNTIIPEGYTNEEAISVSIMYVGYKITDFFGIELASGRSFEKFLDTDTVNDRSSFMLNERLAEQIGWQIDEALGKEIHWIGGNNNRQLIKGRVVGVVKDFHYASLYDEIKPLLFRLSDWGEIAVKYNVRKTGELVPFIEETWSEVMPTQKFDHSFLDDDLNAQYEKEEKLASLINYFTILAVFISCLGLFGLASFTMEQRKREFAIRKALGATIQEVSRLISTDFGKIIGLAAIIACPVAWLLLQEWLNNFTYGIDFHLWYFALAALIGLIVAISTIGVQLFRAANANPVESLRNE